MSLTFTQSLLRTVVAKICNDVGWHSAHISTLNVLADLLNNYIRRLSMIAIDSANLAGRSQATFEDMAVAFQLMGIDMNQMQDYISNVESSPLEFDIPLYPLRNLRNRIYENCIIDSDDVNEKRAEYYHDWLPSLNYSKMPSIEYESHDKSKLYDNQFDFNFHKKEDINIKPLEKRNKNFNIKTHSKNNDMGQETDDQKNKLVFKFSLGRPFEDNVHDITTPPQPIDSNNKVILFQTATSNDIVNHLMSSKAYLRFISQNLLTNLENPEYTKQLRYPDSQRLPNDHKSREHSPEPEPENSDFMNSNPLNTISNNLNLEDINKKVFNKMFNKKNKTKGNDTDGFNMFGEPIKANIKVKEIGTKERNKKEIGEKTPKPKKSKDNANKPLSIKVTGFGLSNEEKTNECLNEPDRNLNVIDDGDTSVKKRQYKRKLKEGVEHKGRKSKKLEFEPKQLNDPNANVVVQPLCESSPIPSNSRLIQSNKKGRPELFNENEAAKTLVLMSESNDTLVKDQDSLKPNDDLTISNNSSENDNESLVDLGDSNSKPTTKKVGRPTTKRNKGVYKKIVKSVEVIESSDSSSEENVDVDQHPVSLLVQPRVSSNENMKEEKKINRKRLNSNSSLSSVSSILSSKSSIAIHQERMLEIPRDDSFDLEVNKQVKSHEEHKIKKIVDEKVIKEPSKHKKNKKHSKNKHRHGDEKQHKKHKKTKDKDRDKERDKDITKIKDKDKEKNFKPKLNIKFGQVSNFDEPPKQSDSSNSQLNKEPEDESFNNFKDCSLINTPKETIKADDPKKKRNTKNKKNNDEVRNELIFIKDTTSKPKESKNKKNQIINVATSLMDDSINMLANKTKSKEEKDNKKVKEKELEIPKMVDESKSKREKVKESKKEKDPKKSQENQSCILIRETINVEGDDRLWICPKCSKPDNGTPMIGCDTCDDWYHYYCVGIHNDPSPDESWFCPHCYEKQKKKFDKYQKKKEKYKAKYEDNSVTITPIPSTDIVCDLTPSVSIFPIGANSQNTATPGYKPTGRPRGRPRKDSSTSNVGKQPSLTITPIGPSSSNYLQNESNIPFDQPYTQANIMANMLNTGEKPTQKKIKEICPKCQIVEELSVNMIGCDNCDQWYHWPCVGINTAPSPDSSWFCAKCSKKKTSKRLWDDLDSDNELLDDIKSTHKGRRIMNSQDGKDMDSDGKWLCGTCKQASTLESSPRWIACDECDQWYHFICEKILNEPKKDESWFCRNCIKKQRNIENQIHSKSKKKI